MLARYFFQRRDASHRIDPHMRHFVAAYLDQFST